MSLYKVPVLGDVDNRVKPENLQTYQTEVDLGDLPVSESSFTVVNSIVTISSKITGSVAYETPTGKDLDEVEMDAIDLKFGPGNGQLTILIKGLEGYLHNKFKINYSIG